MEEIKDIIANNLIELRKKHRLTQNEFANKLNYSDNTVSRWERGEITPSIETLEKISQIFNISLEYLIKKNIQENFEAHQKSSKAKKLALVLVSTSLVWFVTVIAYFYLQSFAKINLWTLFVWSVPVSCLVLLAFVKFFNSRTYSFVVSTVFIWSFITSFYLQFLQHNLFLIFIIGVPAQFALSIWTWLRPKSKK